MAFCQVKAISVELSDLSFGILLVRDSPYIGFDASLDEGMESLAQLNQLLLHLSLIAKTCPHQAQGIRQRSNECPHAATGRSCWPHVCDHLQEIRK